MVFSVSQRDALRGRVLRLAEDDPRVVAGAEVGSLAVDAGDEHSDLDLSFGIADDVAVAGVLEDWTADLGRDAHAVRLVDLPRDPQVYRVLLLPGALQLDLSMAPASQFRRLGPRFRLLFGQEAPRVPLEDPAGATGTLSIPTPAAAQDILGWGVVYALHARACIARRRVWQAAHYVGAVRDHALALACLRHGASPALARHYDDLPDALLARFGEALVGAVEPAALRRGLGAGVRELLREGIEARAASADVIAERLADLR